MQIELKDQTVEAFAKNYHEVYIAKTHTDKAEAKSVEKNKETKKNDTEESEMIKLIRELRNELSELRALLNKEKEENKKLREMPMNPPAVAISQSKTIIQIYV